MVRAYYGSGQRHSVASAAAPKVELLGPLAVVSNSTVSQRPWVMLRVPSALAFSAAGSTNPDGTFLSLAGTVPRVQFLLELAN